MRYQGISFNPEWVRSMSEAEFVEHPLNASHWMQPGFTVSEKVRKEWLRELWRLLNPKKNANNKQPTSGSDQNRFAIGS